MKVVHQLVHQMIKVEFEYHDEASYFVERLSEYEFEWINGPDPSYPHRVEAYGRFPLNLGDL